MSITGSALFAKIASLTGDAREAEIIAAAVAGNFPSWLLDWVPITMQQLGGPDGSVVLHEVTIPVARNGLRIGNNTDQRKTPCNFKSAKTIAKAHGWTFPTPRIVDAIYRAADKQMFMPVPGNFPHAMNLPLAAASRREATETYEEMHNACEFQRDGNTGLSSGDTKVLVLTSNMPDVGGRPSKQIFGGRKGTGAGSPGEGYYQDAPRAPYSPPHDELYVDYSEAQHPIGRGWTFDGKKIDAHDAYKDPTIAAIVAGPDGPFDADALIAKGGVYAYKPGPGLPVRVAPASTTLGRSVRGIAAFTGAIALISGARALADWLERGLKR